MARVTYSSKHIVTIYDVPREDPMAEMLAEVPGVKYHNVVNKPHVITLDIPVNALPMPGVREWIMSLDKNAHVSAPRVDDVELFKPTRPLYAYQEDAARWIVATRACLLADQMGLGKTATAAVAAKTMQDRLRGQPMIIVAPLFLRDVWTNELQALGIIKDPETELVVLQGRKPYSLPNAPWYFLHYDIIAAWWDTLRLKRPGGVIGDEIHMAKNTRSQRGKGMEMILAAQQFKLELTGTPILNRIAEARTLLSFLHGPWAWGGHQDFLKRYMGAYFDGYAWVPAEPTNSEEFRARTSECVLRRTVDDVGSQIPALRRETIDTTLSTSEMRAYEAALGGWRTEQVIAMLRAGQGGKDTLALIAHCRKVLAQAKTPRTVEEIVSLLQQGESVVVFTWQRKTAADIYDAVCRSSLAESQREWEQYEVFQPITGDMDLDSRLDIMHQFQSLPADKPSLIVATYGALGVGVTLTHARTVILHDLDWVPAVMLQAEARVRRIGQTRPVLCKIMTSQGTIDTYFAERLVVKGEVIEAFTGDSEAAGLIDDTGLVEKRINEESLIEEALKGMDS